MGLCGPALARHGRATLTEGATAQRSVPATLKRATYPPGDRLGRATPAAGGGGQVAAATATKLPLFGVALEEMKNFVKVCIHSIYVE